MLALRARLRVRPIPMLILVTLYGSQEIVKVGSFPRDPMAEVINWRKLIQAKRFLEERGSVKT